MTDTVPGRAFGEGRVAEIEGYQERFLRWALAQSVPYSPPHGPLLDVGTNTGYLVHYAAKELGWAGVGIDPQPQGWVIDQEPRPVVLTMGADDLALFNDRSFGFVTFCHVLEHVPDPAYAVQQSARVLRPGGTLAIAVPAPDSEDWLRDSHVTLFTASYLRNMLLDNAAPAALPHTSYLDTVTLRPGKPELWAVWMKA